jgi:hypothetical protein
VSTSPLTQQQIAFDRVEIPSRGINIITSYFFYVKLFTNFDSFVTQKFSHELIQKDCLCGLVVSVEIYKHRGPGFESRALLRIFLRELGRERGPLSLVIG